MAPDRMIAARAAALFASDLSSQGRPSQAAVAAAIRRAIAACGGVRGCLGEVAAAYGERPETAVPRMRWARQTIDAIYSPAAASAMATVLSPDPASLVRGPGRIGRLETGRGHHAVAASGSVLGIDELEGTSSVVSSIA